MISHSHLLAAEYRQTEVLQLPQTILDIRSVLRTKCRVAGKDTAKLLFVFKLSQRSNSPDDNDQKKILL